MKKKLMLMTLLSGVLMGTFSAPTVGGQASPKTINLTAHRFTYDPAEVTLKKGEPVVLVVKSQDVPHGLRMKELDVDLKIPAHGTAQAQFTPDKAGDFVGQCSVFCGSGHGSMKITFHVVE